MRLQRRFGVFAPDSVNVDGEVPILCYLQTFVERHFRRPTQLDNLVAVDVVAEVVEGAVARVFNVFLRVLVLEKATQLVSQFFHGQFIRSANVVNFTNNTLVENGVVRSHYVEHKQETALRFTFTVEAARQSARKARDELGDDLFGVLVRSVNVVGTARSVWSLGNQRTESQQQGT